MERRHRAKEQVVLGIILQGNYLTCLNLETPAVVASSPMVLLRSLALDKRDRIGTELVQGGLGRL